MRTRTPPIFRTTRQRRVIAVAAFVGFATCGLAAAQVVANVIAGGGGVSHSAGGCRTLEGSVGEPVVGVSSGAGFSVHAGYWAGAGGAHRDSLFRNGFEECQ